jgi:AcrR family transcriptional regulator
MVQGPSQYAPVHAALIELCFERGFERVTVEALCLRAGIDRATFDRNYSDLEDCFCQTLEAERDEFFAYLDRALRGQVYWVDRLRAVAYGLLRFLRTNEPRAHFLTIELHVAGERAARIWSETIVSRLFDRIDEGRAEPGSPDSASRATAEAVGGAVFSRIRIAAENGTLLAGEEEVPQLMYLAVLPYLGPKAAQAELSAPPPPDPASSSGGR